MSGEWSVGSAGDCIVMNPRTRRDEVNLLMEWFDVLKISVPVLVAVVGWLLNEHSKRQWERYKRKEDRYVALLEDLKGFYVGADTATAKDDKNSFIHQLDVAWLYCPDSIIHAGYSFLERVSIGFGTSVEENDLAAADLVAQMRKDLLGKKFWFWKQTELEASDYRHLAST